MGGMAVGGLLGALALTAIPLASADRSHVLAALFVEGAFINALQTTLYVLAAQMYPVQMRATGVGGAAGFGRLGAIASSFIGVAVLSGGGPTYFAAIAIAMAVAFVGVACVRRHASPTRRAAGGHGVPAAQAE